MFLLLAVLLLVGCTKTFVEEVEEIPVEKPVQNQTQQIQTNTTQTVVETEEKIVSEPVEEQEVTEIKSGSYLEKGVSRFKTYTLELKGTAEGICGISVNNGPVNWIMEDDSLTIDKLTITVTDVIVSHSYTGETDACKVILQTS